jgi:hypothetical protein
VPLFINTPHALLLRFMLQAGAGMARCIPWRSVLLQANWRLWKNSP